MTDDLIDLNSILLMFERTRSHGSGPMSRATLYRLMRGGQFPKPVTSKWPKSYWSRQEIDAWKVERSYIQMLRDLATPGGEADTSRWIAALNEARSMMSASDEEQFHWLTKKLTGRSGESRVRRERSLRNILSGGYVRVGVDDLSD